ncbi:MAG: hypothetical protein AMK70_03610 [Nitrospira bacterium SG8_35_1]|nr:MAG: hypothetical protein AMK70_03610 [Nitrospira bacterium SG8_35_1]
MGCTCPDKIFEQIEDKQVASFSSPHTRSLTIGGRLLIFIWHVKDRESFKSGLLAMLAAGKKERDERGLNRFRAVLAIAVTPHDIETEAQSYFKQYAGDDNRMHIHVVSSVALRDI